MNWKSFLDTHQVDWVESGSNVSYGNLGIKCPWCGQADPSHHLGIEPISGKWNCWRDPSHKGTTPYYLIQKIARCSKAEARTIWGDDSSAFVELDALEKELLTERTKSSTIVTPREVSFSENEFLLSTNDFSKRFIWYLWRRGFEDPLVTATDYQLRGSITGEFTNRLIFPILYEGVLVGWTARAISDSLVRYKAYPAGGNSIGRRYLYNYDNAAEGGGVLVVCEGPFDTLKIDAYAKEYGIRSVALMGLSLTDPKVKLIDTLSHKFNKTIILLDNGAEWASMEAKDRLCCANNVSVGDFPLDLKAKDAGDLDRVGILRLLQSVI